MSKKEQKTKCCICCCKFSNFVWGRGGGREIAWATLALTTQPLRGDTIPLSEGGSLMREPWAP